MERNLGRCVSIYPDILFTSSFRNSTKRQTSAEHYQAALENRQTTSSTPGMIGAALPPVSLFMYSKCADSPSTPPPLPPPLLTLSAAISLPPCGDRPSVAETPSVHFPPPVSPGGTTGWWMEESRAGEPPLHPLLHILLLLLLLLFLHKSDSPGRNDNFFSVMHNFSSLTIWSFFLKKKKDLR